MPLPLPQLCLWLRHGPFALLTACAFLVHMCLPNVCHGMWKIYPSPIRMCSRFVCARVSLEVWSENGIVARHGIAWHSQGKRKSNADIAHWMHPCCPSTSFSPVSYIFNIFILGKNFTHFVYVCGRLSCASVQKALSALPLPDNADALRAQLRVMNENVRRPSRHKDFKNTWKSAPKRMSNAFILLKSL